MPRKKTQQTSTLHFIATNKNFPNHDNVKYYCEMLACPVCISIAMAKCMEEEEEFRNMILGAVAIFMEETQNKSISKN